MVSIKRLWLPSIVRSIILFVAMAASARASACAIGGKADRVDPPPFAKNVPTNSRIILYDINDKPGMHSCRDLGARLVEDSSGMEVPTQIQEALIDGESACILTPSSLAPATSYRVYGVSSGYSSFTTDVGPDESTPAWTSPPALASACDTYLCLAGWSQCPSGGEPVSTDPCPSWSLFPSLKLSFAASSYAYIEATVGGEIVLLRERGLDHDYPPFDGKPVCFGGMQCRRKDTFDLSAHQGETLCPELVLVDLAGHRSAPVNPCVQVATCPQGPFSPDAGAPSDAGAAQDGDGWDAGQERDAPAVSDPRLSSSGGCGCRLAGGPRPGALFPAVAILVLARRRVRPRPAKRGSAFRAQ